MDVPLAWPALGWLFAGALTVHNAEEGIWLPGFAQKRAYWRLPITTAEMRYVLVLLTLAAWACAWWAAAGSALGTYLLCGTALLMLLNVVVPHLIATIALRAYSPGTGTAVFLNLPASWLLLHRALREGHITTRTFAWAGPAVVAGILLLIPVLFLLLKQKR